MKRDSKLPATQILHPTILPSFLAIFSKQYTLESVICADFSYRLEM